MGNYDTIEISRDDFLPLLNWCLVKFQTDLSSRRSIGGRADKIGGFIDRFSNQCVNWIIFNHLLRKENFKIDPDYFFYNAKTAKKCADIIGLKGEDGKIVPFTYFDKNQWVHMEKAPFIEVKTLRKEQYCAGLGMPQYNDDHYFVYVESEFDELYLFNFFESFLQENDFDMNMNKVYVKDNSENILLFPKTKLPSKIATLRLLGTYKGSDLKKHNLEFPERKNPRYIGNIDQVNEVPIDESKRLSTPMDSDRFVYDPANEKLDDFLPIYTKASSINMIHKEAKTKGYLYIEVKESCFLNQYRLDKGFHKINFETFQRSSKETEIFNHKSTYDKANHHYPIYPNDCTDELIEKMKSLFYG